MKDAIYGRIWKLRITHKDCTNLNRSFDYIYYIIDELDNIFIDILSRI